MKRYLDSIVPLCSMIAVTGTLSIMLESNQNLAKVDDIGRYKHALVSEGMLDAGFVKQDKVQLITENTDVVKEETLETETVEEAETVEETSTTETTVHIKPLPEEIETRTVASQQLNVRIGDNKDTPVVTRVMEGDVVGLTGNTRDNWLEIIVQDEVGTVGWVNGKFLK